MRILFVHNNFPAQFRNLAEALAADASHAVAAIGSETAKPLSGVKLEKYKTPIVEAVGAHSFARRFNGECYRAERVLFAAATLAAAGFVADVIIAHCGWGESLPLRAIFPNAKIIVYCEFYYRPEGQDVHFDTEFPRFGADGLVSLQCKNASTVLALVDSEMGISPTYWQRSTYPIEFQRKIEVVHEGIDTTKVKPDPTAQIVLPDGRTLSKGQEIVTFVSRNLEPMRGFHTFMRALPGILKERPDANALIVGGDGCSYGPPAPQGSSWKTIYFNENACDLDLSRVHFLDRLPYAQYLTVLQLSSLHVYMTYPFVLSWSLLEAMAAGCAIVASDTPPVREVIDGSNGILVPFFDSHALINAVVHLLSFSAKSARLRSAARATIVERYDKNVCVAQALRLMGIGHAQKAANF